MPLTTLTTPSGNCLFSQEIFDNILDHVSPDIPTLSLCSTVCKAWLPRCRYHIFFDVNLTPKLADFLSSSSRIFETITPYIRNAALGGVWSLAERGEYDQVVSLLLTLDNLRGLSIETWSWDFLSLTSSDRILNLKGTLFQNLTTLRLQYLRFPSFQVLALFMDKFFMLEDLLIDNVTWDSSDSIETPTSPLNRNFHAPRRLRRLHIQSSLVKPILLWLVGGDELAHSQRSIILTLHSLNLPELLPSDIYIVGHLLRLLGPFLRHLEIGVFAHNNDIAELRSTSYKEWPQFISSHYTSSVPGLSDTMSLSLNSGLRTLRIHHLTLYHFPPLAITSTTSSQALPSQTSRLSWLVPLLSSTPSSVKELVLSVWLSQEAQLDLIDWPALAVVLAGPLNEHLQLVQIRALGLREGRDDLRGWILTRLLTWHNASKTVQVVFL